MQLGFAKEKEKFQWNTHRNRKMRGRYLDWYWFPHTKKTIRFCGSTVHQRDTRAITFHRSMQTRDFHSFTRILDGGLFKLKCPMFHQKRKTKNRKSIRKRTGSESGWRISSRNNWHYQNVQQSKIPNYSGNQKAKLLHLKDLYTQRQRNRT